MERLSRAQASVRLRYGEVSAAPYSQGIRKQLRGARALVTHLAVQKRRRDHLAGNTEKHLQ
jgi:hypothetical protein